MRCRQTQHDVGHAAFLGYWPEGNWQIPNVRSPRNSRSTMACSCSSRCHPATMTRAMSAADRSHRSREIPGLKVMVPLGLARLIQALPLFDRRPYPVLGSLDVASPQCIDARRLDRMHLHIGTGDRNWIPVPTLSMMSMMLWAPLRTLSSLSDGGKVGLVRLATSSACICSSPAARRRAHESR